MDYELINNKPVFYSLGNFLFNDFSWEYDGSEGQRISKHMHLSEDNRLGALVTVDLANGKQVKIDRMITHSSEVDSSISILPQDDKNYKRFIKLSKNLSIPFYKSLWKIYSAKKEYDLRIGRQLSFMKIAKNLKKIRLSHLIELYRMITKSIRIVAGRSTNPYD